VRLLTRASARHLKHHRAQLVLSVLGVALGVAVVLSIDLATRSARTAFRISAETVSGRATHEITSELGSVDDALFTRIRVDLGVRASAPVVEGFASSPRLSGRALMVLGVDPFSEEPFRSFVADGSSGVDLGAFVTIPHGIVLAAPTAVEADVSPGDSLPARIAGRDWMLPVVGVFQPTDPLARAGSRDVLLMDISGAQDALGMQGRLSRIDLRLPEGNAPAGALARIRGLLSPDESLDPAGTRAQTMASMTDAFDVNLTALSLLALVFGMFLIYNAVTFSVVQRRALLGRLRAIGVTRGEILRLVLTEAAWIGLAGAALGVAAGLPLAEGLVRLVTRTVNDLYFSVSVRGVSIDPRLILEAAALGVGATLLAALAPAVEAAAAPPRPATLRSIAESKARRLVPRAAALGLCLLLLGWLLLEAAARSLGASFGALFLVVSGLALLTPAGAVLLCRALEPVLAVPFGALGRMATRGVVASLSRTAPAVAALVVAVSVTIGLGTMIQSFRRTLESWLDGTLQADVYVSLPGPTASRATGTLSPDLIRAFVSDTAVVGYSTYRDVDIVGAGGSYRLVALDLDPRGEGAFDFLSGSAPRIMRRFQAGDGVVVSEPYAFRHDVAVGDSISIPSRSGALRMPVLGVFYDYGSDQGVVMLSRRVYDRLFDDPGVTSLGLFLSPGADSEAVTRELLARVPEGRTVVVRTNDELRRGSLEIFDRTFRVTAVLRLLAFIVAFVGVLSALMALELERARELGVMRAWGLTPRDVWSLVVAQTGVLGFVSGALAAPMGVVLSVVMIYVVNKRSFGWTLHMHVGLGVLTEAMALAVVGAVLAGLYPAWHMSRTPPALAMRGDGE
jgi:putative ABC transport system permease protein